MGLASHVRIIHLTTILPKVERASWPHAFDAHRRGHIHVISEEPTMPPTIEELLERRTDLSTFLVHLTRDTDDGISAREHLLRILVDCTLLRGAPMGAAAMLAERHGSNQPDFRNTQRVVCFTESPLEHTWMMCANIEARRMRFAPYGVAFTKTWGRIVGVNPVWYVDVTPIGRDWLMNPVNRIVKQAEAAEHFTHDIFRLTPFIETMGRLGQEEGRRPKEFWWEREWRYAGADLTFDPRRVVAVLVPEDDQEQFATDLENRIELDPRYYESLRFLDPRWSLERMIAALAGVRGDLAQPFPSFPPPAP
jgi:hypothetical protein